MRELKAKDKLKDIHPSSLSDLAKNNSSVNTAIAMKKPNAILTYYKCFINPVLPSMCKHIPSCSAYMAQAIQKRGFFKGSVMGTCRILRCNPFSKGGFDPVKDDFKGNAKWLL